LGLKQAGFKVVGAIDNDPLAVETYEVNHPNVEVWSEDIRRVEVSDVKKKLGLRKRQLDLLAGCPPCQGFSALRTRNGAHHIEDERNDLISDFVRFTRELYPKAVMLENVPGLVKDARFVQLRDDLELMGYHVTYRIADAADYGVPQRRRRLILLASRKSAVTFVEPVTRRRTVRQALASLQRPGSSGDPLHDAPEKRREKTMDLIRRIPKDGGSREALGLEEQLRCHQAFNGFKDIYGRMKWRDVAPTITSGCTNPSKGRFLHPEKDRAITLREAAKLQGFPKSYVFSLSRGKSGAAALIGNALPPKLVQHHARMVAATFVRRKRPDART